MEDRIDPRLLGAGQPMGVNEHDQNNDILMSSQTTQPNQPGRAFCSGGLVGLNHSVGGALAPFDPAMPQWGQQRGQQPHRNVSPGTPFGQMPTMNQNTFSDQTLPSTYPLSQQLPYQLPAQRNDNTPSGGLNYPPGDMGYGTHPSSQLGYYGAPAYGSSGGVGFATPGMGQGSETFSFQQPAQGGNGSIGNGLFSQPYGPGLDAELEGADIPSLNAHVQRQFNSIYQLLDKIDVGYDAKRFALSVIQFTRNQYRSEFSMFPLLCQLEPCCAGQPHLEKHVCRIHEWMESAGKLGILDQQLKELDKFRAFYCFPGMADDDWSQPLFNAMIPFPSNSDLALVGHGESSNSANAGGNVISEQDRLPNDKTGTYRGYANSQESADRLMERYLALGNKPGGSLAGFPQDNAGKCRLVRQAFEAMMQLEGSLEAGEAAGSAKKSTAFKRVEQKFRYDLEVELMAWKLLRACERAQKGICKIPRWFSDGRLSHHAEYRTFRDRWKAVLEQLAVSKKLVNALYDVEFVERTAWNVQGEGKRKESNYTGNTRKSEILRQNTRAMHEANASAAQDSGVDEEERPAKRRRT